jgi:hypothetical protein
MAMTMSRRNRLSRVVHLDDITSSKKNAEVLRKLRDNYQNWEDNTLYIVADDDEDEDEENVFIIREGDDLAWLGYFIGRNETLNELHIHFLPEEKCIDCFVKGVNLNRSLRTLTPLTYLGLQSRSLFSVTLTYNSRAYQTVMNSRARRI